MDLFYSPDDGVPAPTFHDDDDDDEDDALLDWALVTRVYTATSRPTRGSGMKSNRPVRNLTRVG